VSPPGTGLFQEGRLYTERTLGKALPIRRTETIFKNPSVSHAGSLKVSPILTKSEKGIRFAFSF